MSQRMQIKGMVSTWSLFSMCFLSFLELHTLSWKSLIAKLPVVAISDDEYRGIAILSECDMGHPGIYLLQSH
jgi:hypothetical protein